MTALLILQVIVVVLMIIVILMQQSSADGFTGGSSSSSGGLLSSRGQANLLTKTTSILATIFIVNSVVLAYIVTHTDRKDSVLDNVIAQEQELAPKAADAAIVPTEEEIEITPAIPLTE